MSRPAPLPGAFFARDARSVAPDLLNKVLVLGGLSARIVEVEAYLGELDPASHAYRGRTARNATMFGPAGRWYVYFTYGMHHCMNVVCGGPGQAMAVLLRAASPCGGLEVMRRRRGSRVRDVDLCNGPAKLCQAFGVDRGRDGDAATGRAATLRIVDDGVAPPDDPVTGPRVGIRVGTDARWRWYVPGDPHVSRPRS